MIAPPRDPPEYEAYAAMCIAAFGLPTLDRHDWLTRIDAANVRLVRDRGRIAGGLSLVAMGMWIGGRRIVTSAVHLVVVAPAQRERGLASALVGAALHELRARGVALAIAYPRVENMYVRAGFHDAGCCVRYRVRPEQIAPRDRSGLRVESVPRAEIAALHAMYRERARETAGNLDRSPWFWQRVLDPGGRLADPIRVVTSDGVVGYAVVQRAGDDVHLRDLVAPAESAAWSALVDHPAQYVAWNGPPVEAYDPAVERVAEQPWFARVCDLRAALTTRGYRPGTHALHLDVRDELLADNAGRWRLDIADGTATVERGGEGHLRVDVRALAALITGHATPERLAARGLLDGEPEAWRAFAGPAPWMPDLF